MPKIRRCECSKTIHYTIKSRFGIQIQKTHFYVMDCHAVFSKPLAMTVSAICGK